MSQRNRTMLLFTAVFLLFPWRGVSAQNQGFAELPLCAPKNPEDRKVRAPLNLFELGTPGSFSIHHIALRFSPILWLSPEEPIDTVPQNFPADTAACNPGNSPCRVAYYKPVDIGANCPSCTPALRTIADAQTNPNAWTDVIPTAVAETLRYVDIKYYFYYPQEVGFARHEHDLETVVVSIGMCRETDRSGIMFAQAIKAAGSAHGVGWYMNELDMTRADGDPTRDVLVPNIVIVEEGKHGSAIDRNGDGVWTPAYDANIHPHDAWGVRDTFRAPSFLANSYRAELTKPRRPANMILPEHNKTFKDDSWHGFGPDVPNNLPTYKLRSASGTICAAIATAGGKLKSLADPDQQMCKKGNVRDAKHSNTARDLSLEPDWGKLRRFLIRTNGAALWRKTWFRRTQPLEWIAYRYDQHPGITFMTPFGVSLPFGWLVGKANVIWRPKPDSAEGAINERKPNWGFEALYTPSSSRSFDWYTSAGIERQGNGRVSTLEGGLRIRATLFSSIPSNAFKRYLTGFRIGIRTTNAFNTTGNFQNIHLVFEAGGGAW